MVTTEEIRQIINDELKPFLKIQDKQDKLLEKYNTCLVNLKQRTVRNETKIESHKWLLRSLFGIMMSEIGAIAYVGIT